MRINIAANLDIGKLNDIIRINKYKEDSFLIMSEKTALDLERQIAYADINGNLILGDNTISKYLGLRIAIYNGFRYGDVEIR